MLSEVVPMSGQSTEGPSPRRRGRLIRRLVWWVAGTVAVVTLAYVGAYLLIGDRLPRDAVISGVKVGGLSEPAARDKLQAAFADRLDDPIPLTVDGRPVRIDPVEAGLGLDAEASVTAAGGGRSGRPGHLWRVLWGGGETSVVPTVDRPRLEAAVAALARRYDVAPRDAALRYQGTQVVRRPARTGLALDQPAAARTVTASYLRAPGPVALPVRTREPEISDAEADGVADGFARPAVSAPVRVVAGRAGTAVITPAMIAKALRFPPRDGTLEPALDANRLSKAARPALRALHLTPPRDATIRLVDGRPRVIRSVDGRSISARDLAAAVKPALPRSGKDRTVTAQVSRQRAAFTTADARRLGVREVTGEFTTYYPYLPYRNINIGRAAELINNTLLKPGEVFSLNGIVGERTRANGFAEGYVISGGRFRRELGGGVSQSATTTFNAMFFAGLEDVEHRPHTLFIDRYPPGREATVAWPSLDLKFRNNTRYGVLVQAFRVPGDWGRRGSITVRIWSTKNYDKVVATPPVRTNFTYGRDITDDSPQCEPMSPVPGFDVRFQRLFYQDGKIVKRENFFWRYRPTDRVRCVSN
jgi:vancomycin resistance protein YoaR